MTSSTLIFGSEKSKTACLIYFRAFLAVYASVLLWVGVWDLMTEKIYYRRQQDGRQVKEWSLMPASIERQAIYVTVGVVLLFICDTFYMNASMDGSNGLNRFWIHESWSLYPRRVLRVCLALVGEFGVWVGLYDIFDQSCPDTFWKDFIAIFGGLFLLVISNTLTSMAFLWPDDAEETEIPDQNSHLSLHIREHVRVVISLIGQNLIWMGTYNMLETYYPTTLTRELMYVFLGLFLMFVTKTFIANSWLPCDYEESPPQSRSAAFYFRAVASLAGQLIHNCGLWTILDVHIRFLEDGMFRNASYVGVGAVLLTFNGAIESNACIPENQADEEDASGSHSPAFGPLAPLINSSSARQQRPDLLGTISGKIKETY